MCLLATCSSCVTGMHWNVMLHKILKVPTSVYAELVSVVHFCSSLRICCILAGGRGPPPPLDPLPPVGPLPPPLKQRPGGGGGC